jgi:hypothetical protein
MTEKYNQLESHFKSEKLFCKHMLKHINNERFTQIQDYLVSDNMRLIMRNPTNEESEVAPSTLTLVHVLQEDPRRQAQLQGQGQGAEAERPARGRDDARLLEAQIPPEKAALGAARRAQDEGAPGAALGQGSDGLKRLWVWDESRLDRRQVGGLIGPEPRRIALDA